MKKKLLKLLSVAVSLAVIFSLASCGNSDSGSVPSEEELLAQLEYDMEASPDPVRNVVILKGTWEEMGRQYAQQMPDVVKRCVSSGLSGLLSEHTYEEGLKALDEQLAYYEEHAPEVTELFKGLADGAGIDFETVALGMASFNGSGFCSTMAAWGKATEDGRLLMGANWDTESGDSYFLPAIMAYPEGGKAFIAGCGFFGNIVMRNCRAGKGTVHIRLCSRLRR